MATSHEHLTGADTMLQEIRKEYIQHDTTSKEKSLWNCPGRDKDDFDTKHYAWMEFSCTKGVPVLSAAQLDAGFTKEIWEAAFQNLISLSGHTKLGSCNALTALHSTPLPCTPHSNPLHSTVHPTARHCIPLHFSTLYFTVLHSTAVHSAALHSTPLPCTPHSTPHQLHTRIHCTPQYAPLHATAFHYISALTVLLYSTPLQSTPLQSTPRHCPALHIPPHTTPIH